MTDNDDPTADAKEPTLAADVVAWAFEGVEDEPLRSTRRRSLVWAALVALVCSGAVAVVGLSVLLLRHPVSRPAPAAAPPPVSAPAATPPPIPSTPAGPRWSGIASQRDLTFLDNIHADQVPYPAEKAANAWAIVTARTLCDDIAKHRSSTGAEAEAFFKKFAEADGWTAEQALTLVTDAVTVYCPELR
ncbi:MAG: DUF732 domain-containing protein [Mycobacterium sp.]|uniref:DUF732 domain-containing protein n=1 Tax=Mycobacterium sp. TaxID=1785 RepID=UPI003F99D87E